MTDTARAIYDAFSAQVDNVQKHRATDVGDILASARDRIAEDTRDEIVDDLLSELVSVIAARAANQVEDVAADGMIAFFETRFSEDVTNASIERRIAALLVGSTVETLQYHLQAIPDEVAAAHLMTM